MYIKTCAYVHGSSSLFFSTVFLPANLMIQGMWRSPAAPLSLPARIALVAVLALLAARPADAWRPWPSLQAKPNSSDALFGASKKYEGSSEFVRLKYHMGPVLTSNITVHVIWYGTWQRTQKAIILDFISSISAAASSVRRPSVAGWWSIVRTYSDQTDRNVSGTVLLGKQFDDLHYSHGKSLTRLSVQSVIKTAVTARRWPLPVDYSGGIYLVLTSDDVYVQDFCKNVCGFHYFTFPSIVGSVLPYAWIGNSNKLCPGTCAYPFAVPEYIPGLKPVRPPNGDAAVDGMVSVIAHEIAELASDPLANAWFAGDEPSSPVEIADLCEGIYGTGGGGSYPGQMLVGKDGATYNMNGLRRRFLVQWVWNHLVSYCSGPNALDHQ
ncbi:hypothetical protein SAY87_024274 [Trapa incisa]|uniref:Protein EXORDIUM-like 3 n=1 Tax=Trapa incisa TaxID=236973 RepID=A0AAN7GCI6_9MYRT|nr:hypothetical protein SAY87_024274 [Trapa incisa]